MLIRAYRFRLEPTAAPDHQLRQFAGARRFIWNRALQQRREHYQQRGKTLLAKKLSARLTALRAQPETAWLREMYSQLLRQVLADVQRAFVNFFERRARHPHFKSRKRDRALSHPAAPKCLWTGCKTFDEGNPGRSKNPRALARGVSRWSGQSRG